VKLFQLVNDSQHSLKASGTTHKTTHDHIPKRHQQHHCQNMNSHKPN